MKARLFQRLHAVVPISHASNVLFHLEQYLLGEGRSSSYMLSSSVILKFCTFYNRELSTEGTRNTQCSAYIEADRSEHLSACASPS